jgi:hypothetical protein
LEASAWPEAFYFLSMPTACLALSRTDLSVAPVAVMLPVPVVVPVEQVPMPDEQVWSSLTRETLSVADWVVDLWESGRTSLWRKNRSVGCSLDGEDAG